MEETTPKIEDQEIIVRAQDTPNPMALRFIVNRSIKKEGKATFISQQQALPYPLIYCLFDISGVVQVYVFQNTLTITQSGELDGDTLKNEVISVIKTRMPIHSDEIIPPGETEVSPVPRDRSSLSPEIQEIEDILDRTVRPGLQADGGDVEVLELKDNELKILFQGACGGCPSAFMGTLDAIQSILRFELKNEDLFVVPI